MLQVTVEVIDTAQEFKWRLMFGETAISPFTSYYEGILTAKWRGVTYAYATDYWNGVLPTEKVFIIKEQ